MLIRRLRHQGDGTGRRVGEHKPSNCNKQIRVRSGFELEHDPRDRFGRHLSSGSSGFGSSSPLSKLLKDSQRRSTMSNVYPLWWKNQVSVERIIAQDTIVRLCDNRGHRRSVSDGEDSGKRRCHWINHMSDPVYLGFHDNIWGVPIYDDQLLFEMLVLSGMLSDYNWTQILTNRDTFREIFSGYDMHIIAKMDAKKISRMGSIKKVMLAESRIRCIINNSKCALKIEEEYRSFSTYIWGFVNYAPIVNVYKHPKDIPRRTRKAEAISKDLVKRGFRFVGPTIVLSFMQVAGITIDHLTNCFRYEECARLSHNPWAVLNIHFNFLREF